MKKTNNYLALGLLFSCISIISATFELLPNFAEGLCVGLGLTFIFMNIIASKYDISKIRKKKISLLKNAFGNKYN